MAKAPNPYQPPAAEPPEPRPDSAGSLERLLNWFSDQDWSWWPFLYLRPAKHERMSTARVAKISLHFSPILTIVLMIVTRQSVTLASVGQTFVAGVLGFFVASRLTFAVAWNLRAKRLAHEK
jgi:hypothetical protein